MKLKIKRPLSLILAAIMLVKMLSLGVFAADEAMGLNEGTLEVKFGSDEYKGTKQDASGKDQEYYIKYPVVYLLSVDTIKKLIEKNGSTDSPKIDLTNNIKTTYASAPGNIKMVKSVTYDPSGVNDGTELLYRDEKKESEGKDKIYTENIDTFGYLKIQMNNKGGVGLRSDIIVSFETDLYPGTYRVPLNVTIIHNPDIFEALKQPKGVAWEGKSGIAKWEKVDGNKGNDPEQQPYKLFLVKKTANGSMEVVFSGSFKDNAGIKELRYDFSSLIEQNGPGEYYFQVAAIGNGTEAAPEGAFSDYSLPFKYVVPRVQLGDATKLEWVRKADKITSQWTGAKSIKVPDYYEAMLIKTDDKNVDTEIREKHFVAAGDKKETSLLYDYISNQIALGYDMTGKYAFKLRALSGRRLEILDGEWSKVSNILEVKNGEIFIDGTSVTGKVNQAPLKLTAKPAKINVGQEAALSVSGGSSKGAVTYKILSGGSNAGDGVMSGNKFQATRPGVVRIQATMKGLKVKDKDYNDVLSNIIEIFVEVAPVELESKPNGNSSVLVIPDDKIRDLIALAPYQEHGAAVISPGSKGKATSIAVPGKALSKLADSSKVKGVAIAFPSGLKLRMDSAALDSVLSQSKGEHIVFNMKEIKSSEKTITVQQKAFLDKEKPVKIFEISITSDGKTIYTSEGANKGTLYLTIPYSPKDINATPSLYHLDGNGYSDMVYTEYDLNRGSVIAELAHLSIYYLTEGQAASATGKVKLNFATNGGSTIKAIEEEKGREVNLSYYTTTRTGFVFEGWYSDPDLTKAISKVRLSGDTTVYAKWLPVNVYSGFVDVPYNAWYYGAIEAMLEHDIMGGVSSNKFAPNAPTTRAMIVTMLYRLEGSPAVKKSASFKDVKADSYYNKAVAWAASNKIVKGYGEGKFGPNDKITREQMAAILKSYATYKKYNTSASARISQFKDFGRVSSYAVESVEWAVGENLLGGKGNGLLDPRGKATRAEVASIFQRFLEKFA